MAVIAEGKTDWRFRFHAGHQWPACIDPAALFTSSYHASIKPSNPHDPRVSVSSPPLRSDTTNFPSSPIPLPPDITLPQSSTSPLPTSQASPGTSRRSQSPEIIFDTVQTASSRRCSTLTQVSPNNSTSFASPTAIPRSPRYIPSLSPRIPQTCPFKNCKWSPVSGSASSRSSVIRHISQYHKHRCERGCENVGFQTPRDRDRHHNSGIHRQSNQADHMYRCGGCGHLENRRDNHLRHLGTCSSVQYKSSYVCGLCGRDSDTHKDEHHTHVQHCMKQRGRKKANLASSPVDTNT